MSPSPPLTIWLVDDCAEDRAVYRRFLQQDNFYTYDIVEFETATTVLQQCQQEMPDVILLDFGLPDRNGLTLLQQIREQFSHTQSVVIMLTGQRDVDTAVYTFKGGAQDYLDKGQLTPEALHRAIHIAVEQKHLLQKLEHSQEQQRLVATIALRIRQSLQLEKILQVTVAEVRQFLQGDRVVVYQFHPDMSGTIVAESVLSGWTKALGMQIEDTCFQQGTGADYVQGKKRAIDHIHQAGLTDCHIQLLERFEVKANLVVPLLVNNQLWGLLIVHQCSAPRQWQAIELDFLDQLAVQLAIAIQQAVAYSQLQAELIRRQQAEATLRDNEERLRLALTATNQGLYDLNLQTGEAIVNSEYATMLGYDPAEFHETSVSWIERLHPDDRETTGNTYRAYVSGEIPEYQAMFRQRTKNGSWKWILSLGKIVAWDDQGQPLRMLGTYTDISARKQAEADRLRVETLKIELQLLESILESTLAGYWDWDIPGNQEYLSPTFKQMFGYEDHELPNIPATWQRLIFLEDLPKVISCFEQHVSSQGQIPFYNEVRYRHKDGSTIWVICSGQVIEWDQAGNPLRMLGCHIDITARKQAEEALKISEARYRAIVEDQTELIARFLSDGTMLFVNEAYCRYFGLHREDLIGKNYTPVVFEADLELVNRLVQSMSMENPTVTIENRVVVQGEVRWTQWINRMLFNEQGQFIEVQAVGRDITDRKRAEETLTNYAAALRRSNQELEQFAYVASHDLQEPLRTITSYTQLFARKYQGSLDAKAEKYISYIVDGTIRMQQLIRDLLSYSRAGRQDLKLEPIDCNTLLSEVKANLQLAIAENQVKLNYGPLPMVLGDYTQLLLLFQNLISNAIKYRSVASPQIEIRATAQDNYWRFAIQDNGIGIEPQYAERIFVIFQRLHPRNEYSGTGLGLAIAKRIVERHNGIIWVESKLGEGSTFYFTLPMPPDES